MQSGRQRIIVSNKIAEYRKRLDMTQTEFAKAVGVSINAVGAWEYGKWTVTQENAQIIADLFGVEIHDIFYIK